VGSSIERLSQVVLGQIRIVSEKAKALEENGMDVIHLEIGEPDFNTPNHIVEAAQKALTDGKVHYAPNRGLPNLRKLIANKLLNENNLTVNADKNIIMTQGAAEGLAIAFFATLNPGDEIIIIEPSFTSYENLAHLVNAKPVSVKTYESNNWIVNPDDIRAVITPDTKVVLLNSPSNPTGAVYPKETLEEIAKIAIEEDLIVISDEIYEKIIYSSEGHFSIGSISGMEDRTITINGFSKAYSMTGWRLGYIVANESLITSMLKVHQYVVTCVPTFTQYGAVAVYEQHELSEEEVRKMREAYKIRKNIVYEGLRSIDGITLANPEGAFYAFPNISKLGLSSKDFATRLLEEEGVATVPGSVFSDVGEGYVRISYAASEAQLKEAIKRIERFVKNIK